MTFFFLGTLGFFFMTITSSSSSSLSSSNATFGSTTVLSLDLTGVVVTCGLTSAFGLTTSLPFVFLMVSICWTNGATNSFFASTASFLRLIIFSVASCCAFVLSLFGFSNGSFLSSKVSLLSSIYTRMLENKIFRNYISSMEIENMITKSATEYVEKTFGNKDNELKTVVLMNLTLDDEDPDDEYKKEKFLNKLRRQKERDVKAIKELRNFLVHDASGNLVPYIIS